MDTNDDDSWRKRAPKPPPETPEDELRELLDELARSNPDTEEEMCQLRAKLAASDPETQAESRRACDGCAECRSTMTTIDSAKWRSPRPPR